MVNKYNIQHSALGGLWGFGAPLIVSIIASIAIISAGENSSLGDNIVFNVIIGLLTELSFFAVFYTISKRRQVDWVQASGIKTKSPWYFYIIAILLGIVCVFLFNPIISLWEQLLEILGYKLNTELSFPLDNIGYLFLALLVVGVVPAICEEFLFRGLILNGLRNYGAVISIGVSALLFSLMHMNLQQLPYTIILGIVLGLIVYYTKNIWLSILLHFFNNATAIFIMFFTKPIDNPFVWYDILIAIVCVLGAVALLWLVIYAIKKVLSKQPQTQEIEDTAVVDKPTRNKLIITPIVVGLLFLIIFSLVNFGVI